MASDPNTSGASAVAFWTRASTVTGELPGPDARQLTLGLLHLRRLWELFDRRRKAIAAESHDPRSVHFTVSETDRAQLLERQELYRASKVAWIPRAARWPTLRAYAGQPNLGRLIDAGIHALEHENPPLAGTLPRAYGALHVRQSVIVELIALVERTITTHPDPVGWADALLRACPDFPKSSTLGDSAEARMRTLRSLSSQAPYGKLLDRLDDQLRELDKLIDESRRSRTREK